MQWGGGGDEKGRGESSPHHDGGGKWGGEHKVGGRRTQGCSRGMIKTKIMMKRETRKGVGTTEYNSESKCQHT